MWPGETNRWYDRNKRANRRVLIIGSNGGSTLEWTLSILDFQYGVKVPFINKRMTFVICILFMICSLHCKLLKGYSLTQVKSAPWIHPHIILKTRKINFS